MRYKRVLVKLSGAALAGEDAVGLNADSVDYIAKEIIEACKLGTEVGVVVGGGNIFRGSLAELWNIDRAEADNVGIVGTVINSLVLRGALRSRSDLEVRVMTSVPMNTIAEPYIRLRAIYHLERKFVVIFAGGNGQPFVTTDYPSVQRALETNCDAILVAKHGVDGVLTGDPRKEKNVELYKSLTYDDVLDKNIRVMDQSAVMLARDHSLPVHVFNFNAPGSMARIIQGEDVGTLIAKDVPTVTKDR